MSPRLVVCLATHLLLSLSISALLCCSDQYEAIPPKFVTSAEINFKGQNERQVLTSILYSVPDKYHPRRPHPLLVALHGSGSNAVAFHDLWKSTTDTLGFVLLTPQGDEKTKEGVGWRWGNNAERSVLIAIDLVKKSVHVDRDRIYLAGFSSGGTLAYYLGLRHSNLFRGMAALSAGFEGEYLPKSQVLIHKLKVYWSRLARAQDR